MSMQLDPERVTAVVREAIESLVSDQGGACQLSSETILFGAAGALLDSMGLVNLIADLEARVEAEFGCQLVLADERAMSRSRSPFRTVSTVTAHIVELAGEGA